MKKYIQLCILDLALVLVAIFPYSEKTAFVIVQTVVFFILATNLEDNIKLALNKRREEKGLETKRSIPYPVMLAVEIVLLVVTAFIEPTHKILYGVQTYIGVSIALEIKQTVHILISKKRGINISEDQDLEEEKEKELAENRDYKYLGLAVVDAAIIMLIFIPKADNEVFSILQIAVFVIMGLRGNYNLRRCFFGKKYKSEEIASTVNK